MMTRVVVTGGAGFIGSHLTARLVEEGYTVTVIDNLTTGKLARIEGLLGKDSIEFVRGSITDLPLLTKVFQGVRAVFHLAAMPSVPRSIVEPVASHEANATGTLKVLVAASENKVGKVIFSSSSSVYGDTPVLPKEETMTPGPLSPYAVSKLAGEYYCSVFEKVYGLSTVCLRYFNVFGPGQDPDSQYAAVIPRFIQRGLENKPPVIFGDGEQTRDFTFVKDVVAANILFQKNDARGIFNISCGEQITVTDLAQQIINLTGSNAKPAYEDPRPGDIKHSLADISKAQAAGFKPAYDLQAGLTETVRFFRKD